LKHVSTPARILAFRPFTDNHATGVVENLRFAESARDDSVNKVRKRPKTLKPTKKVPAKNATPQATISVNRSGGASPRDDTTSEENETSSEEESEYTDDELLDEGPGLEEVSEYSVCDLSLHFDPHPNLRALIFLHSFTTVHKAFRFVTF
jgi:hypothetical protein